MVKNLVKKGDLKQPVVIYNRTVSTAQSLAEEVGQSSATVAKSVAEAVESADLVFICLANDDVLKQTIDQALEVNIRGKTFIDATTVHPDTSNQLAEKVKAKGGDYASMTG